MIGVILAAGRGSRLGIKEGISHKCLQQVHGKPLISYQIAALKNIDIDNIIVVTGFNASVLRSLEDQCQFVYNEKWSYTNMLSSLMSAGSYLKDDSAIITYSDIFYPSNALKQLALSPYDFSLLYSTCWKQLWLQRFSCPLSDAESFTIDNSIVTDIGSQILDLDHPSGQYMGVLKTNPSSFNLISQIYNTLSPQIQHQIDITGFLRDYVIPKHRVVHGVPYNGIWGEVDSRKDLDLYNNNISYSF